jgi:hypothetical protein
MDADRGGVRIGDRQAALRALAEHFAEGRLTVAELDQRKQRVDAATTTTELKAVFEDLPAPHPMFAEDLAGDDSADRGDHGSRGGYDSSEDDVAYGDYLDFGEEEPGLFRLTLYGFLWIAAIAGGIAVLVFLFKLVVYIAVIILIAATVVGALIALIIGGILGD